MQEEWTDAGATGDIPENECKLVDIDDDMVAVYNLDGEYFAVEDVCPHDGGDLSSGWVKAGCAVCPRHGAQFDIRTGKVMAPPAHEDIHAFPVRVQDGRIQVRDNRDD